MGISKMRDRELADPFGLFSGGNNNWLVRGAIKAAAAKEAKEAAKRRAKRLAYEKANPVKAWKPKPQPLSRMAKMFMKMRNFKIPKKAAPVKKVVKAVVKAAAKKPRQCRRRRPDMVWAVAIGGVPYYRRGKSGKWTRISGTVKQMTNGPVGTFALNRHGIPYYRMGTHENPQSGGRGWQKLGGRLAQISAGKNSLWGINRHGAIYCMTPTVSRSGKLSGRWQRVGGRLKQISASKDSDVIWGVNPHGAVYYKLSRRHRWQKIPGTLAQIKVGNRGVYGINNHGIIYFRKGTGRKPSSPGCGWIRINQARIGRLKNVAVGHNGIWGPPSRGYIYTRVPGGKWSRIVGKVAQISSN